MNDQALGNGEQDDVGSATESSAQLVSRVANAAQKREETTQREAQRQRPAYILDVEQSEVAYTLRPKFMPLAHIDYETFARFMEDRWSLTLDLSSVKVDPSVIRRVSEGAADGEADLDSAIVRHILQGPKPELSFTGGRFPVSKTDFVEIRHVVLSYETVFVSVAGISQVAESVAQETAELVNAAAGADRTWDVLGDEVQVVVYATRTRVDLGSDSAFENLLSPALLSFLDRELVNGARYGAHAGGYHARNQLGPPKNAQVSFSLDDLTLRIASFDSPTAIWRESDVRFSVTARGDYRSGKVSISSELPYDMHERLVGELIQALKPSPSD